MITTYKTFVPFLMGNGSSLRTGLKLLEMGCKKVFVVYDAGLKNAGISDKIVESLQNAGIETVEFSDVVADPPDELVERAAEIAREAGVDGIVAVGGGSAIDSAKAINVLMNNPAPVKQYIGLAKNLKPGVKLVFIPTTSGTGSETTDMTVLSIVSENKKASVISTVCVADLAILDPELTLGLPPKMTAATGVDAFAHAVESLTGNHANPISDALAREAIRAIVKWLPIAVEDGSNVEAREKMMLASTFAGMAFTNALVHMGHSIGHTFGALYHIAHGIACSLALPEVIEYTAKSEWTKVIQICECMDIAVPEDASPEEIGAIAREGIRAFFDKVEMPRLSALDIPVEELPKVAMLTMNDAGLALIPYRISTAALTALLMKAYAA